MSFHDDMQQHEIGLNATTHTSTRVESRRFDRWFEQKLKAARQHPFAELVILTPEMASWLVGRNPENRGVREDQVSKIASDIVMGRWEFNGETIIVSEEGYLNDGQHRCLAVMRAMIPIKTMITFGASRDSRTTVDDGRARTVSDYLAMEGGHKNTAALAAVAHQVLEVAVHGRLMNGTTLISKQTILEECRNNPAISDSVAFISHCKKARKVAHFTTLALAHYLLAQKNREAADEFMATMIEGDNLTAGDGRFVCREKLLARDLRLTKNEQVKSIISGWNNWRVGKKVKNIVHSMKRGEKFPGISA